MDNALGFDDISLVPQYSDLNSRSEVDMSTQIGSMTLSTPIFSSPMDTVTEGAMQEAMSKEGGIGVHHRYCHTDKLLLASKKGPIAVSPSMGTRFIDELCMVTCGATVVIDVAHGHSKQALDYARYCVNSGCEVISGNIVTEQAAEDYLHIGVNIMRVGVGSGAACSTRLVAGVGIPQVTAIENVRAAVDHEAYIISDGGINHSGDIVKALAVGADAVMIGRLLAGCDEAPGITDVINGEKVKRYRGMASGEALDEAGKERNVEGVSAWIPRTGTVHEVMEELKSGIRAGFAYLGARNIVQLWCASEYVQVTPLGLMESKPRI